MQIFETKIVQNLRKMPKYNRCRYFLVKIVIHSGVKQLFGLGD